MAQTEYEVEDVLRRLGIEFVHQHPIPGTRYVADFFLPYHHRTILEVDGWLRDKIPRQRARAAQRDAVCRALGYGVVRIKDDDIYRLGAKAAVVQGLAQCLSL